MWNFKKELLKTSFEEDKIIIENVDYLVFKYGFSDGRDLDTCTQLLVPIQEAKLGYSQTGNNTSNIYSKWGGDNTGTGVESILIDVKKLKQDFPLEEFIEFSCGGNWFGQRVSGNVTMTVNAYNGGTMAVSNFEFLNTGGTLVRIFDFSVVNIVLNQPSPQPLASETIGVFRYTISTGLLEKIG